MYRHLAAAWLLVCAGCGGRSAPPASAPKPPLIADFDRLVELIDHEYIYRAASGCDSGELRGQLRKRALAAASRDQLLPVLERALECVHDHHATFNTNLETSTRLVPTGLQVWAAWTDREAVVTQVRHDSAAWHAGVRRGDVIVTIDDMPTDDAVEHRLPCCIRGERARRAAREWALLALLAGRHDQQNHLTLWRHGVPRVVRFGEHVEGRADDGALANVMWQRNPDGSGYISVNNLGDTESVAAFDAALAALRDASELFLDLRNTPSGGTTDVAEPILGRFIDREQPYQRIEPMRGDAWVRRVAPRGPWQFTRPVTVLVSRWTGSMGEGMAIGLDAMRRARVCGSRMAGLQGSVFDHALPATGIVVRLPGERLSHVDGTPREQFVPPVVVEDAESEGAVGDAAWIASSIAACREHR
jgi:carboxyl-terminal processing protease